MPSIRRLSPETTGKIAAGEVIERPVNAVKELVENSLDASASRIRIEVENGGKTLIRLTDDGVGIRSADLPLAVENFSTSKISDIEDLYKIRTLGFRGEALASIRSISHLRIRSGSADEEAGREMAWEGGAISHDSPAAAGQGTEITVSNLFFNLPARKKFLGGDASELRRITSMVQSFALAFPEVQFWLYSNGRELLSYPASSPDERTEAVLGPDIYPSMKPFEKQEGPIRVHGYASVPGLTRGNRSFQFIYVNNRIVKDRLIAHALRQAYHSMIPSDKFPLAVLFLEIPPSEIDVNVHPAKSEIRFRNESDVHRMVSSAVREIFEGKTISFRDKVESVYRTIFPGGRAFEAHDKDQDAVKGPTGENPDLDVFSAAAADHRADWMFYESPQSLFDAGSEEGKEEIASSDKLYWQLHQSYIFIQIRRGMVIIDQHAAHERILYNRAKNQLNGEKPAVQSLLFPATLELTPDEYDRYDRLASVLPSLGFEVEPFGLRSIIVRGIPAGVKNWDEGRLLQDMLAADDSGKNSVDDILKTLACKGAIKAGEKLSLEEMQSLTDQLFATDFPFTCPHGRPTMLRVEIADLEKRFHRTVTRGK